MNKTELYNAMTTELEAIFEANKASKKLQEELRRLLDTYIKPKTSSSKHPPIEGEDGEMLYYCRYTQEYYPQELMVFSNGKSKGYSKVASNLWARANNKIKKIQGEIVENLEDSTKCSELKEQIEAIKELMSSPEAFRDGSLAKALED